MEELIKLKKFYDTNAILKFYNSIGEKFVLSSTTLIELENIKVSRNKDEHLKYNARKAIRFLNDNCDMYEVVIMNQDIIDMLNNLYLGNTQDNQICVSAKYYNDNIEPIEFC